MHDSDGGDSVEELESGRSMKKEHSMRAKAASRAPENATPTALRARVLEAVRTVYRDERSLLLFSKESTFRKGCDWIAKRESFQTFVFAVVVFNAIVLAMELPERAYEARGGSIPLTKTGSEAVQLVFVLVFAFEALVKIIADGFWIDPHGYLRSRSNVFDFVVVIVGILDLSMSGSSGIGTLRLLRTLQPLRALYKFNSGRLVLETMRKAVPLLMDVVVFMSWFVIMCTVTGVMIFGGKLSAREYVASNESGADAAEKCANLVQEYPQTHGATEFPDAPSDEDICLYSRVNKVVSNGVYCCESNHMPADGFVNYDDFGRGAFVVLQVMTVDGWNEIAWPTARGAGAGAALPFYFIVVLLGGFFVLQLFTSVICATLSEIEDDHGEDSGANIEAKAHHMAQRLGSTRTLSKFSTHLLGALSYQGMSSGALDSEEELEEAAASAAGGKSRLVRFRRKVQTFVRHPRFGTFVNLVIILNTFAMMSVTADGNANLEAFRSNAEYFFFSVFCTEFVLKNVAFGARKYWSTPWNKLDGVVVLTGILDIVMEGLSTSAGVNLSFLRILRVLRILRIARIFQRSSSFQKVIRSVVLGAQRIWVFLIVWAIFMAMFSVLGTQLFSAKGDMDDERLNFKDFFSSIITLFVVSTGENTFEVAWATMKASGIPAGLYMVVWSLITTSILALVLGILIDSISDDFDTARLLLNSDSKVQRLAMEMSRNFGLDVAADDVPEWIVRRAQQKADEEDDRKQAGASARDVHEPLDDSEDEIKGYASAEDDAADFLNMFTFSNGSTTTKTHKEQVRLIHDVAVVRHWLVTLGYEKHSEKSLETARRMRRQAVVRARQRLDRGYQNGEARRRAVLDEIAYRLSNQSVQQKRLQEMSIRCMATKSDDIHAEVALKEVDTDLIPYAALYPTPMQDEEEETLSPDERFVREDNFQIVTSIYDIDTDTELGVWRLRVLRFVKHPFFDRLILLLIIASSALLATETQTFPEPGSSVEKRYEQLDIVFNTCFTVEMGLKLFAFTFTRSHGAYAKSKFNLMDAGVVLSSWLIVFLGDTLPIRSLRVLRILRPLRTVQRVKGLRVVVQAIMISLPSVTSVCIVGLAILTMLSVLGMELFLGKMHRCTSTSNMDNVIDKASCLAAGGVWRKAKFNFDSFPEAFLTIFIVASGDNWQDIMFETMDVVGVDKQPVYDNSKWASVYFLVSILFAMLLWSNLFVSTLVDNFTRVSNSESNGSALITDEQRIWQHAMQLAITHTDNSWRRAKPINSPVRAVIHTVVSKYSFDAFCIAMILTNMVLVMMYRVDATETEDKLQVFGNNALAVWYVVEAIALIVAMRWPNYWKSGWNKIDLVVAISGLFGLLVPQVYESGLGGYFRMLRFLRLFKLVEISKGLRTLFATFLGALPGVVNVAMLSLLATFIYACLGVAFFGDIEDVSGTGLSEYSNFQTFPKAMSLLFVSYTGNWAGYFSDVYVDNRCFEESPLPAGVSCTPRYLAIAYFCSYVIFGVFFLGNLFIAIVLERFSFCANAEGMWDGEEKMSLIATTVTLQRVSKLIVRRVKAMNALTPKEKQSIITERRQRTGGSTNASGATTPNTGSTPGGDASTRHMALSRMSSALDENELNAEGLEAFEDAGATIVRARDALSDVKNSATEHSGERSGGEPTTSDVGSDLDDDAANDIEGLRRALSLVLPKQTEVDLRAATDAVSEFIRSRSRSRSRRGMSRSTSVDWRENRSDDDQETVRSLSRSRDAYATPPREARSAVRSTEMATSQLTRGRSVIRRGSQAMQAAARRIARVGSSRHASSSEDEDGGPAASQRRQSRSNSIARRAAVAAAAPREFATSSDSEDEGSVDMAQL